MAFKFVILCSFLAVANAGVIAPLATYAVAHHNVAIANPAVDAVASTQQNVVRSFGGTVSTYSKAVDTPYSSVRKTDTRISNNVYTPAVAKTVTYAAPAVAYAAPAVTKTVVATAPAAAVYAHAATPVLYSHPAPAQALVKQVISYSPAVNVAHVTFDGFGTHWGY